MAKKLTTEEFIKRAKEVHGDKYDYSRVEYVNIFTPVSIICSVHGLFKQLPNGHINGKQECPKCSHQSYPSTKEDFVEKSKLIYGDKYTYEKVDYKNNKTKVIITCSEHGDFSVRPDNFLHGHGCKKCAINKSPQCQPWTTEEFIERAKKIYPNKYTYEKTNYKNYKTKIIVTCEKHGDFETDPDNFLHGHSCPHCAKSLMENRVKQLLDECQINYEQQKTFNWLKNIGKLKIDFYLPDYNIALECQGLQHYKPIEMFGGEERLKIIQERDRIKKDLCEKHGIKILYFSDFKDKLPNFVIKDKKVLLEKIYEKNFNNT